MQGLQINHAATSQSAAATNQAAAISTHRPSQLKHPPAFRLGWSAAGKQLTTRRHSLTRLACIWCGLLLLGGKGGGEGGVGGKQLLNA
jgi:hypothetical protein